MCSCYFYFENLICRKAAVDGYFISPRYTIDRLQEKVSDLGRLERHLGREQMQLIVERSKALEQAERANKRSKRAFEMSR